MIVRALIVLLAVLNLGVATWWLLRPEPSAPAVPQPPAGVATLELVRTLDPGSRPAPAPVPAATSAPAPAPGTALAAPVPAAPATVCLRTGPFAGRDEAAALQSRLGALLQRSRLEEDAGEAEMYRVLLPPVASREAAQATVARLQEAGFNDVLVLQQGAEANAVALGTFRNRDMAERRVAAMQQLGFPAELREMGRGQPPRWWLLLATTEEAKVRQVAGDARAINCSRVRGTGT